MTTLIQLLYYQRPNMVRTALRSVAQQTSTDWVLIVHDDSDPSFTPRIRDFLFEEFPAHLQPQVFLCEINDNAQTKMANGGSRVGEKMNEVLDAVEHDLAIMLCDDDALRHDYIENGARYFTQHPEQQYAYCHVQIFNPLLEIPSPSLPPRVYFTNHTTPIYPSCQVDASQVMWRKGINARFPSPQTRNLDAHFYSQLAEYGPGQFMGCVGQYKAIFDDQLGNRRDDYVVNAK